MWEAPENEMIGKTNKHRHFLILTGLFIIIAYFPLFLHLDTDPIHAWDESMFAMRAYQLANSGTFLENFGDYPAGFDNPNIKPPFGTYFQALAFKLIGYNELAMRLPVALYCLATGVLLIWFFYRYFGNPLLGFLAALVLVCSPGYITPHLARTGDHEGILAFLVLAALIGFYQYIETGKAKYIYLSAIFFAFGFLTKNLVAFFPLPAMLLYLIYKRQLLSFLSTWAVWRSIWLLIMILAIQYLIIWMVSPYNFRFLGLANVQDRFVNVIHGHAAPMFFYWTELAEWKFFPWVMLLPIGLGALAFKKFTAYRSLMLLLFGSAISHLVVVSISQTKLPWYDASVYPWLSIIAAFGLWAVWDMLSTKLGQAIAIKVAAASIMVLAVFGYSYAQIVKENMTHRIYSPQQHIGLLLQEVRDQHPEIMTLKVVDAGSRGNLVASFYISSMNDHGDRNIQWQTNTEGLTMGDTIGYCNNSVGQWADSLYSQTSLLSKGGCKVVVLTDSIKTSHTTQH